MRTKMLNSMLRTAAFAGFLLTAGVSSAQTDVYLQAQSFQKDVGDGVMVDMWGFASCGAGFTGCVNGAPGPQIDINTATDLPLNIHLKNTLSTPVSIVIPGQAGGGNPVRDAGGRVQSFTTEITAGADTGATPYTWSSLRPGTYLYQSGTHPSLQVPMGLYGALAVVDGAYPGVAYDNDAVLLFSEIDPIQNGRVVAAAAEAGKGTPTQACVSMADYLGGMVGYPCTIDYNPMYFLVNGEAAPNLAALGSTTPSSVLLRLLNAGLRSHTPSIVGRDSLVVFLV
jgi:FtsP/CotA-like multicopper oxidase with cupredoxin domain